MKALCDEICQRFPEIRDRIAHGDEELTYVMMHHVADWLKSKSRKELTPEVIQRIKAFMDWCCEQPKGSSASDDIHTILVVGFYEELFETELIREILPQLISKEDFTRNAHYLKTCVGEENYQKATKHYTSARR